MLFIFYTYYDVFTEQFASFADHVILSLLQRDQTAESLSTQLLGPGDVGVRNLYRIAIYK